MKKIIYILILSISLISCVDLNEDVRSKVSANNYYKTLSDADAALVGLYSSLTHNYSGVDLGLAQASWSYYNRLYIVSFATLTDDVTAGLKGNDAEYRATAYFNHTSSGSKFTHLWRLSFEIINRANAIIDRVPSIQDDTARVNNIVREAKFIRASLYYNTVRFWGPVPLVLHETTSLSDLQVSRTDSATIYAQIKKDLNDASALPAARNSYHVTSGAARSLLLSVAVTQRNWTEAVKQYNGIINGGYDYKLFDNFSDNFSTIKKNTEEHIFDAYYFADGTTGGTGNVNAVATSEAPIYGYPGLKKNGVEVYPVQKNKGSATQGVNFALRNVYKKGDVRIAATFSDTIYKDAAQTKKYYYPHFKKFRDYTTTAVANSGVNYPIIRFAEDILYYAEAKNEIDGPGDPNDATSAIAAINQIRKRAKLSNLTTGLSKDNFRDSVFLERRLEFAEEAFVRYFDLVRVNGSGHYLIEKSVPALLNSGLKSTDSDGGLSYDIAVTRNLNFTANPKKYLLLPIPYTELLANPNLTQNPGWE